MKKFIYLLIFCSLCLNTAYARWANFDDAWIKGSQFWEVNIDENGKKDYVVAMEVEILKEKGRDFASPYYITYNDDNEKITVIDAKAIYKDKEYKLDAKLIKDQPLASVSQGFDQFRQISLAFPKLAIGAKIYLKYSRTQKRAEIDGVHADLFSFDNDMLMEKETIKLRSKLPLNIAINDPERVLKIKKDRPDNFYNLEISLIRPMYKSVVGEQGNNILNKKYLTYFSLSNLKTGEDLAQKIGAMGYDKVFSQSLPSDFALIASDAAKETSEVDQINLVTSRLIDKIQYMGDWRSVEGRLVPHPLAVISKTQVGDCKDFSAATAAIMAKLGYKAQMAFVLRGVGNYSYPNALPNSGDFNHVIVKLTNKHGVVRWIDPTNFISMADGIFPDIAGKMAFVVDPNEPSYEKIPDVDPLHAQSIFNTETVILGDGSIIETGHTIIKNELLLGLTGAEMRGTKKAIKDAIFFQAAGEDLEEKNKLSMTLPDLKSRIVKDVDIHYSYRQENKLLKTNLGSSLKQSYDELKSLFSTPTYYVQDIFIGPHPFSMKRRSVIKNVTVENVESLNNEIKSPWLYVNRRCSFKDNDLHIEYDFIVYENLIPNEAIRSPEFIKLKSELDKNFRDVAIVLDRLPMKK